MMRVLSIQEFKEKFEVEKLTLGMFKSGKYGWEARKRNGTLTSGPISTSLAEKLKKKEINKDDAAFVEYRWDTFGKELKKSVWLLQIKPSMQQIEALEAQFVLLSQLNLQKKKLYGERMKPFSQQQINYHLGNTRQDGCYVEFNIPKKNGKYRTISAPNHGLKIVQACLNLLLQEKYTPTAAAMGFVPGRSVADNATLHIGQNYVFNIDLKDFFPTITSSRVFAKLQTPPYSFDKATASIITDLCCFKGLLPQGAPTSPIITNIICERLDWRLSKLANRYGLKYSRYADDITFSGMSNLFHKDGVFVKDLYHFIEKEGFRINEEKTRLNTKNFRQEVTGLTVNEKPNVSKEYVKTLRAMIHKWEVLGHDAAQKLMAEKYFSDGKKSPKGIPQIENVIGGKLNYMKMIKGGSDTTYHKLNERYQVLVQRDFGIIQVIEKWKSDGIDEACKLLVGKQPWNGLLDKWHGSLCDFEELIGEKVVFSPSRSLNTNTAEVESESKQNNNLAGLLTKLGMKPDGLYIATINNQQYWGKVKLVCDRGLDLNKEIFVSYGVIEGASVSSFSKKSVFFFSNMNGYLSWGEGKVKVIDQASSQEILDNFAEGKLNKQTLLLCLKEILSSNIASSEVRKLRTDLILGEFDAILNSIEDKPMVLSSLEKKKKRLLPVFNKAQNGSFSGKYHSPQEVVNLLKSFTTEGKMLKYTTHPWDGAMEESVYKEKDYTTFVRLYQEEAKDLKDTIKKYHEPLGNMIYYFLINDEDKKKKDGTKVKASWGRHNIKIGYCYPKDYMRTWMESNPGMQPFDMPLSAFPQEYHPEPIEGRVLADFGDIVNIFKESIEYRGDNLYYKCESLCREIGLHVNREKLKTLKGICFYTYTEAIEEVIETILRQCKQYPQFPKVEISAKVEKAADGNKFVLLEILHIDSYSNKPLDDDKINLNGGQLRGIKQNLRSLCDWSVESKFKDENGELGTWRIDYLYSEEYDALPRKERIAECAGFKHVMKFYL